MVEPCNPSINKTVLPNHTDFSSRQLGFLEHHFSPCNDLPSSSTVSSDLAATMNQVCAELDSDLQNLQTHLAKLTVSWVSRLFGAKTALHKLNLNLHNLTIHTASHYGIGSKKTQKILGEDLPRLMKEMQQIENVRSYAETTLKLEALVGDLEDAVFGFINRQTGKMSSSISTDVGPRQEKLLQAIKAMNDIEDVLVTVVKSHPDWHYLIKSVDARVEKTLGVLRPQVLADHRALLASLGWPPKTLTSTIESGKVQDLPNPLVLMQVDKSKTYSESFLALCALQYLQSRREQRQLNLLGHKESNIGLWAIDELVTPIASRTEYHFAKWIDQPELMFALVYKITRDFILGVDDVLQPLIDRARLVSYSAKESWVHAMIQMLSGFLEKRVFSVLAERYKEKQAKPEVISSWLHLIDLIIAFDKRMQSLVVTETHLFGGFEGFSRGISVFTVFCDRPDWLKIWAKIEFKDACKKLKAESKGETAWLVDNRRESESHIAGRTEEFLLHSREDHKAPLIAESALKIAWEMIERSRTLPSILSRSQFIRSTSARFLWYFFDILVWRYKGTEFPANILDDDSLTRVCILINAARYCESKLQQWSDDVSFLEMRMPENDSNSHTEDDATDNNSCFFEEEIKTLSELETSWLMEMITDLLRQFETLSWEYVEINEHGARKQKEGEALNIAVSVELVEALDTIRSHLNVIRTSLNPKDFLDLWRSVANGLDHFIFRSILMSDYRLSEEGINQFCADMQALFVVFQPFCARPEAFFPCTRDSLKLLKLNKEDVRHLKVILSEDEDRMKYLHCSGISHISFDQAWKILRNSKFDI